jgi:molybdate transport system substrate-binding protein
MAFERSRAEPITGISSMATRHALTELARAYEHQSGQRVAIEAVGGVDAIRRVQAGEPFDFVVLAADAIDRLAVAGCVDAANRINFARSGVTVAVKSGALRPEIGTESDLKRAVLAARSVGYSTGPSGVYLARLFERWGIAEAIASRTVQAPPGIPVAALLTRGEVELGFQQLSELINEPGVEVIGPLPPEIQVETTFSAAVCTASRRADVTSALLSFFASPVAEAAKRRHGMDPG